MVPVRSVTMLDMRALRGTTRAIDIMPGRPWTDRRDVGRTAGSMISDPRPRRVHHVIVCVVGRATPLMVGRLEGHIRGRRYCICRFGSFPTDAWVE